MGLFSYLFSRKARPAVEAAAKSLIEHPDDWKEVYGTLRHVRGTIIDPHVFLSMDNPHVMNLTLHEMRVLNHAIQHRAASIIEGKHGNP